MASKSREPNHTRGSSTSRMARGFASMAASMAACVVVLSGLTAALGAQGGDKAKVIEAVKSDLSRLADSSARGSRRTGPSPPTCVPWPSRPRAVRTSSCRTPRPVRGRPTPRTRRCSPCRASSSGNCLPDKRPPKSPSARSRRRASRWRYAGRAATPATPAPRRQPAAVLERPGNAHAGGAGSTGDGSQAGDSAPAAGGQSPCGPSAAAPVAPVMRPRSSSFPPAHRPVAPHWPTPARREAWLTRESPRR